MENCKFCQAELKEDSTVCPVCGKDNAVPEETAETVPAAETPAEDAAKEAPAEAAEEIPAEEKKSPVKLILAVISVLAVVAILVAMVVGGSKKPVSKETVPEEMMETVEATVPADGNPDDETCKGSYTADDAAVIAAHDQVIATAGENELTNGELQVYYWMEVRNFLSQYGAYAAYIGMDYQQPLDTQTCGVTDKPMTWQQYFLSTALKSWQTYGAMSAEAVKVGYPMDEAYQQIVDGLDADLADAAQQNGMGSAQELIQSSLGAGTTVEDYRQFMTRYYRGYSYYMNQMDALKPTDEDLETYFQDHQTEFEASNLTKDDLYVDVRHILIMPEAAEGAEEADEAAWAAAEAKANEIYQLWQDGEMTEDSFAALAGEHTQDPGSMQTGGLYEKVAQGDMVEAFDAWCFDPARQIGDHGIVKTNYGYHIMFFSGSAPVWVDYATDGYLQEKTVELLTSTADKYPLTVRYSDILLAIAELDA